MVILSERSSGYVAALAMIQLGLLLSAFVVLRLTRTSISQG
jgi:iron(III) transport system permease protein